MDNLDRLAYWINERDTVRIKKEAGQPKPWSRDKTFQKTYFCNVNREHDTVTRWIRDRYLNWSEIEFNIVVARLINWPPTLETLGLLGGPNSGYVQNTLENLQMTGAKVFGNAYIVSTNGNAVGKAQYIAETLLPAAWDCITGQITHLRGASLATAHAALMRCNGLGSFLAAQVIADLKYTKGHPLCNAEDWGSWAAPGPGSLRGLSWLGLDSTNFLFQLMSLRSELISHEMLSDECEGWIIDLQNLQNCLCEFDKYMRVSSGAGRSKRKYNGS